MGTGSVPKSKQVSVMGFVWVFSVFEMGLLRG